MAQKIREGWKDDEDLTGTIEQMAILARGMMGKRLTYKELIKEVGA